MLATVDLRDSDGGDLHGNHLHVSALQVPVKGLLVALDNGDIVGVEAELATASMFAQRGALARGEVFGFRLLFSNGQALAPETHLCVVVGVDVAREWKREGSSMERRRGTKDAPA